MAIEHVAALDAVAREQHGLVTTAQATELLGPSRKSRWVAERRLLSVQPSVFRLAGAPETWHQAVHATALAADGIVSHRSAAELWGLIEPAGYIDVTIPPDRRPRIRPPAVAHRVKDLRPDLAVERQGMRITDAVRTIVDLGLVLPMWSVSAALGKGLSTRLFTIVQAQALREALGRRGRNGTGVIGELIERRLLTAGGDHSELETKLARLVGRFSLPMPQLQHEVWAAGRFVAQIDAAYPQIKLAIEVDGYAWHSSPEAFQHDRTRQNRLVALGWTVLRFTWADVVTQPGMVARTIREALARLDAA